MNIFLKNKIDNEITKQADIDFLFPEYEVIIEPESIENTKDETTKLNRKGNLFLFNSTVDSYDDS